MSTLVIEEVAFDSALAQQLVAEVQQEYVTRYGGPDRTPVDPLQFASPYGAFFVATVDGEPIGCGGLRRHDDGVVEVKRMFVRSAHRRRGHARSCCAHSRTAPEPAAIAGSSWRPVSRSRRRSRCIPARATRRSTASATTRTRRCPAASPRICKQHRHQPSCSSTKHQRHDSPGSKLRITGWLICSKCRVACRSGDESQHPTWPQVRHSRRCTQCVPSRRHSSQPSGCWDVRRRGPRRGGRRAPCPRCGP